MELSRQAQGDLGENSAESQQIVAAAELLGRLLLQDVERTDDGVSLKDGVSRDRMMSVHDPEMRHGRKSSSKRFDGHKAAIVVDTGTQLITAVEVLPGNAPDNLGALELVPFVTQMVLSIVRWKVTSVIPAQSGMTGRVNSSASFPVSRQLSSGNGTSGATAKPTPVCWWWRPWAKPPTATAIPGRPSPMRDAP